MVARAARSQSRPTEAQGYNQRLILRIPVRQHGQGLSGNSRRVALWRGPRSSLAASSLTPVTFPRTLGTVGQVASAVIAVVGAIPTGGTSLVALVPNLIALAGTVTDNLPAIAKELFTSEQKHLDAAREAYETVQKDVEQVIGAGKAVVDLIGAVDKLTQGAKPDTARHVQMVAAAAEAARPRTGWK